MHPPSPERLLRSRHLMIWLVLGGLLLLMVLIAANADRTLRSLQIRNQALRDDFIRRDGLLDRLRLELYQSSINLNNCLFDSTPSHEARNRQLLETTWHGIGDTLGNLQSTLDGEQTDRLKRLEQVFATFRDGIEPILSWTSAQKREQARIVLVQQVLPTYETMTRLVEEVVVANGKEVGSEEDSIGMTFSTLRWRLNAVTLVAVLLGVALALFSFRRISDLERASQGYYNEAIHAQQDLQGLSARLMAAQEEERRRLSRELHDELGQTMSSVLVELGSVESMLSNSDDHARTRLKLARSLAENAVTTMRDMALVLRPSMLDDLGLIPALRWQAREVQRRTGMKVTVMAEKIPDDLPDEQRTCIYRVVQEAVRNACRHACADSVRITVRRDPGHIRVSVQDNGSGFDAQREKGMGILGMEERVRSVSGAFRVDSEPGSGTVVGILVPVNSKGQTAHELSTYHSG
jgi:signal transduction histidine kinase